MALPVPTANRGGSLFETILSALVIVVAIAFAVYLVEKTGTGHIGSYTIRVSLVDAAGLDVGDDVRVSGARVGSVQSLDVDKPRYGAIVRVSIRDDLPLPADTAAKVTGSALGDVYLTLEPGASDRMVAPGGMIGAISQPRPRKRPRAES